MKNLEIALLGYITWTIFLLLLIMMRRTTLTLTGKKAPNSFKPGADDLGGFDHRLERAHANCIENLPIFGSLALFCIFKQYYEITDKFALVLIGARIAQSITHLISTSVIGVSIRFALFVIQILIMVEWIYCILTI